MRTSIALYAVTGSGGLCSVVEKGYRGLCGSLFEQASIIVSVGVTLGDIWAVQVSEENDLVICVVWYKLGKPGRWSYNLAAWFPGRIHNGDGIGAVMWLKGGNGVLLVSSVESYRGVLIRYMRRNECGGVCVLLAVNLDDAVLGIGGMLWEVVNALRVLYQNDVRFAVERV